MSRREAAFPRFTEDVTLVVPAINSSAYLDIVLSFYRNHGIPVTVFVDDRSSDNTFTIAQQFAPKVLTISNPESGLVEGLIEPMARACPSKWILRIDDDELPSLSLLRFAHETAAQNTFPAHGFLRHQCAVSQRGELLAHRGVDPVDHRQWRLFQPARVRFNPALHTPSFEWDHAPAANLAPPEACLVHLDWAVHSYEERRRKVEQYDGHAPNGGAKWRSYYLHEEEPAAPESFTALAFDEFEQPCLEISRRFPNLCVECA